MDKSHKIGQICKEGGIAQSQDPNSHKAPEIVFVNDIIKLLKHYFLLGVNVFPGI